VPASVSDSGVRFGSFWSECRGGGVLVWNHSGFGDLKLGLRVWGHLSEIGVQVLGIFG